MHLRVWEEVCEAGKVRMCAFAYVFFFLQYVRVSPLLMCILMCFNFSNFYMTRSILMGKELYAICLAKSLQFQIWEKLHCLLGNVFCLFVVVF